MGLPRLKTSVSVSAPWTVFQSEASPAAIVAEIASLWLRAPLPRVTIFMTIEACSQRSIVARVPGDSVDSPELDPSSWASSKSESFWILREFVSLSLILVFLYFSFLRRYFDRGKCRITIIRAIWRLILGVSCLVEEWLLISGFNPHFPSRRGVFKGFGRMSSRHPVA